MIETIALTNFLSYGGGTTTLDMRPLNVLVGPNAAGKSNFVEALAVLRAVPGDLHAYIKKGGGVGQWIWRGQEARPDRAGLSVFLRQATRADEAPAAPRSQYQLFFGERHRQFTVLDEYIAGDPELDTNLLVFRYFMGGPILNADRQWSRSRQRGRIDKTQSILSQHPDPDRIPGITKISAFLGGIHIYRGWTFGPDAPTRASCLSNVPGAILAEDFSNLPARLLVLKQSPRIMQRLLKLLAELSPGFTGLEVHAEAERLQLYLIEGDRKVPACCLSDGTLRYLALLTLLLDPGPVSMVVIEAPELGLHPDMLPTIRDLLIEASERVQLVVTTHSSQLLDTLTYHADSVIICERHGAITTLERLVQEDIDSLSKFGGLGVLWMSGRLGGTRW